MKVLFTSAANRDLEEIVTYLEEHDESASLFLDDVDAAVEHLARWPDSGSRREELSRHSRLRFWLIEPHQLVYMREAAQLRVFAVLHTSRDIRRELRKRINETES